MKALEKYVRKQVERIFAPQVQKLKEKRDKLLAKRSENVKEVAAAFREASSAACREVAKKYAKKLGGLTEVAEDLFRDVAVVYDGRVEKMFVDTALETDYYKDGGGCSHALHVGGSPELQQVSRELKELRMRIEDEIDKIGAYRALGWKAETLEKYLSELASKVKAGGLE